MKNEPQAIVDEFDGHERSSADGSVEMIVIGSLLTLLLVLGTPILGKISGVDEGPSLQVIREGE